MSKTLGESVHADADHVGLPSDGTGTAGDFVTFDGSGQVTPVSAAGDDVIGVLAEDAPAAGEDVGVHLQGAVVANVAGTVTAGDVLEPDGTNAGRTTTNSDGTHKAVDEGGTATYSLAMDHPRALVDAGTSYKGATLGTNETVVKLP